MSSKYRPKEKPDFSNGNLEIFKPSTVTPSATEHARQCTAILPLQPQDVRSVLRNLQFGAADPLGTQPMSCGSEENHPNSPPVHPKIESKLASELLERGAFCLKGLGLVAKQSSGIRV